MNNMTPLQQKLSNPLQLPSSATNIPGLMKILADDDLTYRQLANAMKQYPEITARLIFLANSSWSSPINPITNIEQACSRLGISIVKSVSIAISIASSFDTRKCPSFNLSHFWATSMLVSEAAGTLASNITNQEIIPDFEKVAQTAGVLHNLGLLWLADNFPLETDQAIQMIEDESISLSLNDALKQCIGAGYCEIGGWIAEQLQFPEPLIVSMTHHLDDDYQQSSWQMALLVGSAAKISSALHNQANEIATIPHLELLGLDSATQNLIFQTLSRSFEKTCELADTLFG